MSPVIIMPSRQYDIAVVDATPICPSPKVNMSSSRSMFRDASRDAASLMVISCRTA
jgi:hypothetical protein